VKKLLIVTLTMVFVLGLMGGVAGAMSDEGLEASPAFSGEPGHWTHENGSPRFDTDNFRMAVPGEGSSNANLEDSVLSREGDTLIDPLPEYE